ncbi:MAG: DEAD/DEAH box helicase [Spirochaetaceae bacterium]
MSDESRFHPATVRWFEGRFGLPTEVQRKSRPLVARGEHVLLVAPTGSGKTLAAFLHALDRLLSGSWPSDELSVLYVSPLKALNTDVRENLITPLAELAREFESAPEIRVGTRSGDTPPAERRRMLREPPAILTTTPESLNLLLSSRGGRSILGSLRVVILDEVHAVAGNKRGVHLMTAVERLVELSGEFQRIALSATVRPLDVVCRFVGGGRRVRTVETVTTKALDMTVHGVAGDTRPEGESAGAGAGAGSAASCGSTGAPGAGGGTQAPRSPWEPLAEELLRLVEGNRTTLCFATNRRDAERIALLLNRRAGERIAYAHHGSLSREVRRLVESSLRTGELRAVAATSSLELGIDIGDIDEVVFVKTPHSITSCVQMSGRSGHHVGERSRAGIYPMFAAETMEAVVIASATVARDIEPIRPVRNPLDVLAQVLLSMIVVEPRSLDKLFAFIRRVATYADLTRKEFDGVIELLAGSYGATRRRELEPRIDIDRIAGTVTARPGAELLLYHSGGTIPDRGYYELRTSGDGSRLGELDEQFVWERRIGEVFVFGNRPWRIVRITDREVLVEPADDAGRAVPFWRGEPTWRPAHLADRLLTFAEEADQFIDSTAPGTPELSAWIRDHGLHNGGAGAPASVYGKLSVTEKGAEDCADFLLSQRRHTGVGLPHRRRLVLEYVLDDPSRPSRRILCHSLWGGAVNFPLSILLEASLEESGVSGVTATAGNDTILIESPRLRGSDEAVEAATTAERVRSAINGLPELPEHIARRLRGRLERSAFFAGRFRENAGRALLLPRPGFDRRMPLWLTRRRSRQLLEAVREYPDFPITMETWRSCLEEYFDLDALTALIGDIHAGAVEIITTTTETPSPLARDILWQGTNTGIYETDTGVYHAGVSEEALQRTVLSPSLRPRLPQELVTTFRRRLQRVEADYAPDDTQELMRWISERTVVPEAEWRELCTAVLRNPKEGRRPTPARVLKIHPPTARGYLVADIQHVPRILRALGYEPAELLIEPADKETEGIDLDSLLAQARQAEPEELTAESRTSAARWLLATWLRYEPPCTAQEITEALGLDPATAGHCLATLREEGTVVDEVLVGSEETPRVCDAENLERLLRWFRTEGRRAVSPKPARLIVPFLAERGNLISPGTGHDGLVSALEPLLGLSLPAELWEEGILPVRVHDYDGSALDALLRDSDILWLSLRSREIAFSYRPELTLLCRALPEADRRMAPDSAEYESAAPEKSGASSVELSPLRVGGRMSVSDLALGTRRHREAVHRRLWEAAVRGEVTADSFVPVREAVQRRFRFPPPATESAGARIEAQRNVRGRGSRYSHRRRRPRTSESVLWYSLHDEYDCEQERQELERIEIEKDRARILLDRYGVVFRELLAYELPGFQFRDVFPALRLMELSGEVVVGRFFKGPQGVQFARPEEMARLQRVEQHCRSTEPPVYFLNALDPASPCGWALGDLGYRTPRRHPGTYLAFCGSEPALVARRSGAEVEVRLPPDHPLLAKVLGLFHMLTTRRIRPLTRVTVGSINDEDPTESPYRQAFEAAGFAPAYRSLVLWARYR